MKGSALGVVLAAVVLAAAGGASVAYADACTLRGAKVLAQSTELRVLVRPGGPEGSDVYACLRGQRPFFVEERSAEIAATKFQLVGPYMAYRLVSGSSGGLGYGVVLVDARKRRAVASMTIHERGRFVLGSDGAVVVAYETTGGLGIAALTAKTRTGGGVRELSSGPADPNSLAVSRDGRAGYWTERGVVRSALLR